MKKAFLLFAAGALISGGGLWGALSRQVVSYDIQARLVPDTKTVQGHEVLTWTNDSATPVGELRFHLYMNAFKNNRTTFMTESGGSHRGFKADKDNWGFITVKKIAVRDGADLTGAMAAIQPDDRNPDDQTVMKVICRRPWRRKRRSPWSSISRPSCPRCSPAPGSPGISS